MCELKIIKSALTGTGNAQAQAVATLLDRRPPFDAVLAQAIADLEAVDTAAMTPLNRMVIASAIDQLHRLSSPAAESA